MPAPTLTSMAQRACIRSLDNILDVADIPYELIKPVLRKIRNPQQLHNLEQASPHIADADAELWRAFIARDIPNWQDKIIEPKNPRSWWKVYRKLVREEERAKEEQEAKLAAAMSGIKQEKDANRAQFVQKVIPQSSKGKAYIDGQPNPNSTGWGGIRVPALKNAKRGTDALAAIRRQSSQTAKDRTIHRPKTFSRSTGPDTKSQIKAAPDWMIREKQKPAPNAALAARAASSPFEGNGKKDGQQVFAPRAKTAQQRAVDDAIKSSNAEREARLRALTGSKPGGAANSPPPPRATGNGASPPRTATAPRAAGSTDADVSRGNPGAALNRTSSPISAVTAVKKRPAGGSSPFMPAKKVKR